MNKEAANGKGKGKGKAKKGNGKEKQLDVPAEWVGKSVEELKSLVDQLECDLDKARNSRARYLLLLSSPCTSMHFKHSSPP